MKWFDRVKAAFQRLKNAPIKNREVKQFGIALGERILEMVGFGKQEGSCGPRQIEIFERYSDDLVVEIRVPYCSDADLGLMRQALRILEEEAVAMTPVDTGRLKNSRYSEVALENAGKTVRGTYGYDVGRVYRTTSTGRTVFYALAVHNRNAYHGRDKYPRNPERAQWKFLEMAIKNQAIKGQIQELFR